MHYLKRMLAIHLLLDLPLHLLLDLLLDVHILLDIHPPTPILRSPVVPQPPESVVRRLFTPPRTVSIVIF